MSTWLYLHCISHDPPLSADGESGQHLYDLPQIRSDIADGDFLARALDDDGLEFTDHFRRNTAIFMRQHSECQIGIRDEYGRWHPTTEERA